jgi:hypothetical protein
MRNIFKPSKRIKHKKIYSMAGKKYLSKADEMNKEIDRLHKIDTKGLYCLVN